LNASHSWRHQNNCGQKRLTFSLAPLPTPFWYPLTALARTEWIGLGSLIYLPGLHSTLQQVDRDPYPSSNSKQCLHAERLVGNQFSKLSDINTPPSRLSARATHGEGKGFSPEEIYSLLVNNLVQDLQPSCSLSSPYCPQACQANAVLHHLHFHRNSLSLWGIGSYASLTRGRFEGSFQDLFRHTLEPIDENLRDSKIDESNVPETILSSV